MSSRFLLRFDDACPTMSRRIWDPLETLLIATGVKPLVSVVPNNQDQALMLDSPEAGFWDRVRRWQGLGWAIGIHGYRHEYVTREPGVLRIKSASEFAGLPEEEQRDKLDAAFQVFETEAIRPDAWVAPGHSFDRVTIRLLRSMGVRVISDGFYLYPAVDDLGLIWVPQQLWRFRDLPFGVWTVCLHPNNWDEAALRRFREDVQLFKDRVVDLGSLLQEFADRKISLVDRVFAASYQALRRRRRVGR